MSTSFSVNGKPVTAEREKKLLRFLRDDLHITSVKDGCSEGSCGACTVLINGEIVRSKAMDDNPNDLLDRRDSLVEKLAGLANITTDTRDSDEFMVHIEGEVLVQGSVKRNFNLVPDVNNNGYDKVVWADTGIEANVQGGQLGALLGLRDGDIRSEIQSLNTMAVNFADLVNDVHKNAIGSNNVTGLDFFVHHEFVNDVKGNYDRNGDGTAD